MDLLVCEPSSSLGGAQYDLAACAAGRRVTSPLPTVALDRAYAPLRCRAATPSLNDAQLQRVWQLFSPTRPLGLVCAAYAIAPLGREDAVSELTPWHRRGWWCPRRGSVAAWTPARRAGLAGPQPHQLAHPEPCANWRS